MEGSLGLGFELCVPLNFKYTWEIIESEYRRRQDDSSKDDAGRVK